MPCRHILALFAVLVLSWPNKALAQVTFEPHGCEFRVWFVSEPTITKATLPIVDGGTIETTIGELNPLLNDGYAHFFRAECTQIDLGSMSQADLIDDMATLVQMNQLQDAKIWAEELATGEMVGRARASLDAGERVYHLDIRRYVGESSVFDAWAGAESFPQKE